MRTIVITGANRGLGLGLTRYFVLKGDRVIATARKPDEARELQQMSQEAPNRCIIETLDVNSEVSVQAFAAKCADHGSVDVLVNNAGVLLEAEHSFKDLSFEKIIASIEVNTIGPMRLTRAMLPLLSKSKKPVVANLSSKMGSIADNTGGGYYGYRMSKAALNMFNKSFATDFPNITSVVFHPGWVQTEMGGKNAPTKVDESTTGLGKLIDGLDKAMSGKFIDFQGQSIAW